MSLPLFPGAKGCGRISKRKGLDDFIIANNCSHQDKDSLITFPAQKYQGNQKRTFPFDLPRCLLCCGPLWCCAVPGAGCEAEGIWGSQGSSSWCGVLVIRGVPGWRCSASSCLPIRIYFTDRLQAGLGFHVPDSLSGA